MLESENAGWWSWCHRLLHFSDSINGCSSNMGKILGRKWQVAITKCPLLTIVSGITSEKTKRKKAEEETEECDDEHLAEGLAGLAEEAAGEEKKSEDDEEVWDEEDEEEFDLDEGKNRGTIRQKVQRVGYSLARSGVSTVQLDEVMMSCFRQLESLKEMLSQMDIGQLTRDGAAGLDQLILQWKGNIQSNLVNFGQRV